MAVQILRGGMHDQVGAVLDRPGQDRRGDRVVGGERRPGIVRYASRGADIRDRPERVGRRLDIDKARDTRLDRRRQRLGISRIDKRDVQAPAHGPFAQPFRRAEIHRLRYDHMVARRQSLEDRARGRHARSKKLGAGAALKRLQQAFRDRIGRVVVPAVAALPYALVAFVARICRRWMDRRRYRPGVGTQKAIAARGPGFRFLVVLTGHRATVRRKVNRGFSNRPDVGQPCDGRERP